MTRCKVDFTSDRKMQKLVTLSDAFMHEKRDLWMKGEINVTVYR